MSPINIINQRNSLAAAKIEAERTTHWVELPTGEIAINVLSPEGKVLKKILDAKSSKSFLKDLENHDGVKALWQHRQAVCRKHAK